MSPWRAVSRVAALVAIPLLATTGAAPDLEPPAAPTAIHSDHVVVALGDSVPSGAACSCAPFPALYAALLGRRSGTPVRVDDYAVDGLATAGLLAQLSRARFAAAVRRADVLLVTIGANDFKDHHDEVVAGACTGDDDCVSDELASMRARLVRVLAEVHDLRRGRPTTVLVTGYWNVFEDGVVARQTSPAAGLTASLRLTRRVNSAISSVSDANDAVYVDLFAPFQRHGRDIDRFLAADGDHPDAAGHRLIARTLLQAGLPHLVTDSSRHRAAWVGHPPALHASAAGR